jgi:predicted dehydrogenase
VYARDLASRIAETKLVAIADPVEAVAKEVAAEFDVPKSYGDPLALIDDPAVDAIVIVSPTHTHRELVIAAASRKKPTFCEKPPALSLDEVAAMQEAISASGMFLQMGFMRRFDAGYASAKKQIEEGRIGMPLVFKSTSRDPFRPSLEYANPKSSGGMLLDMGIHDFDLARWFMGEVRTVSTIGATIAYPELATVGDIDNAVASLTFASGKLGVVDLSRSGIYGYDISTEILGLEGTLKIGYLRETPVMLMTKNSVAHDTVPYFMERFRDAYTTQLQNFAQNVQQQRPAPITIEDGMEALRIGVAATRAHETGRSVVVSAIKA